MAITCCGHCEDADDLFSRRTAARDLRRYRKSGPRGSTRLLIDALRRAGVRGRTLLDIGGGVGAIQHDLLQRGAASAMQVDASMAYLQASRDEAGRRGHRERVEYLYGDFVALAPELPAADIVTLDRVICCYPDMEGLVTASLSKAKELCGLVYPRERVATRFALAIGNTLLRLRGSSFRGYLHSDAVDALIRSHGFRRRSHAQTLLWHVVTYARQPGSGG
jgi:predicted RNA methylase